MSDFLIYVAVIGPCLCLGYLYLKALDFISDTVDEVVTGITKPKPPPQVHVHTYTIHQAPPQERPRTRQRYEEAQVEEACPINCRKK